MNEWQNFKTYLDYIKTHFESMKTWSDKDKLQETIFAIENEIKRLRNENIID